MKPDPLGILAAVLATLILFVALACICCWALICACNILLRTRQRTVHVTRRLLACGSVEVVEIYPDLPGEEVRAILLPRAARHHVETWLPLFYRVRDDGWSCPEAEEMAENC